MVCCFGGEGVAAFAQQHYIAQLDAYATADVYLAGIGRKTQHHTFCRKQEPQRGYGGQHNNAQRPLPDWYRYRVAAVSAGLK